MEVAGDGLAVPACCFSSAIDFDFGVDAGRDGIDLSSGGTDTGRRMERTTKDEGEGANGAFDADCLGRAILISCCIVLLCPGTDCIPSMALGPPRI
ncbi:MAG: hypothetical protein ACD_63C00194G0001 [uncultured bacterium]|nr:MAG: hypothetical protein ACD_63C00194G0001 [uncultured bacterium]